jgi:hypothetical protein
MPTDHPCDDGSHGCDMSSTQCLQNEYASYSSYDTAPSYMCECLEGYVSDPDSETSCMATTAPIRLPTAAPTSSPTSDFVDHVYVQYTMPSRIEPDQITAANVIFFANTTIRIRKEDIELLNLSQQPINEVSSRRMQSSGQNVYKYRMTVMLAELSRFVGWLRDLRYWEFLSSFLGLDLCHLIGDEADAHQFECLNNQSVLVISDACGKLEPGELNCDSSTMIVNKSKDGCECACVDGYAADPTTTSRCIQKEHAKVPSKAPTREPTKAPTKAPTKEPTKAPTMEPTKAPTKAPTMEPTKAPSKAPTSAPTPHYCEDGSNFCWTSGEGADGPSAVCTAKAGDDYTCECPAGYVQTVAHVSHASSSLGTAMQHECAKSAAPPPAAGDLYILKDHPHPPPPPLRGLQRESNQTQEPYLAARPTELELAALNCSKFHQLEKQAKQNANGASEPPPWEQTFLSSQVWLSSASVLHVAGSPSSSLYGGDGLPYFCRFTNIVVDLVSIYFAAQPGQERQAHRDIQDCCYAEKKICNASVSASFCQCFHVFKYRAAVLPAMIARQMAHQVFIADSSTHQIPAMENLTCIWPSPPGICNQSSGVPGRSKFIRRISGNSWLMHFWSTLKHPDHFNMKVLELSGEYQQLQSKGIKKISTLICMDYLCDNLNAYEKFILKLLHARLKQEPKLVSVNSLDDYHAQAQLMGHIFNPDGSLKKDMVHGKVGTWFVGNPVWLENACMSPRYKHILTDQKAPLLLRTALQSVIPSYSCEQPNSGWKKRVAIMQRVDGNGLRRFINFQAVLAELQVVFGIDDVSVLFFSGATPPELQASLMCSFDVLLSPHTSQLTNLLFAPPWATLVEVQPNVTHWSTASGGHEKDRTFQTYALNVGMASILVDQNTLGMGASANNWRRADLVVDLTELRCAFRAAGITYTENASSDDPRERGSIIVAHATPRASQQAYFGYELRSQKCDWFFYLAQHPDLRAAFGNDTQKAAAHYRQTGEAEGRNCGTEVVVEDGLEWMVRKVQKVLRVLHVSEVQVRILHLRVPPTNPIDGKLDVLVLPPNTPAEWIQQIRGLRKMHRCNTGDFIWLSSGLAYQWPGRCAGVEQSSPQSRGDQANAMGVKAGYDNR